MNHEEIEEKLIPLRDYEKSCREIYLANPEAFRNVVWNWEEFKERFRATDNSGYALGEEPPVFMGNLLTGQICFQCGIGIKHPGNLMETVQLAADIIVNLLVHVIHIFIGLLQKLIFS